tara:strand:+ start:114 stop:1880 length:1767 start_codon:yes stop_codon:yes gene_type:complete
MTTFWGASSKIPVKQTSTAISSQNGLQYSAGQVIHIDIPPSVKFIQPRESVLQFDFKISNPVNASNGHTRLQLDAEIGAQSLIRDIRIYSSPENGGVLLEEIQNYNAMVSIKNSYDTDDSLKNKRAISGEGTTTYKPQNRGTQGTPKSMCADLTTNPYFVSSEAGNHAIPFTNSSFTTCKMQLPLHTGIWSSDKVFPNLLTGCRIEIVLEDADRCLRQLESAIFENRCSLNPVFDSENGSNTATKSDIGNASAITEFYIQKLNNNLTPQSCPFVVGECISFVDPTGDPNNLATFTNGSGVVAPRILQINSSATASTNAGLIQIVLDNTYTMNKAITITKGWVVCSVSARESTDFRPSYTVSNVEMLVQELDMGQTYENSMRKSMTEGGVIGYDILTATNYKYSQLQSDIVANIRLPLVESRARAICCLATDSTSYLSQDRVSGKGTYNINGAFDGMTTSNSTRTGLTGISDNISSYQFNYDGKLQPSRLVSCAKTSSKKSIDAQPVIELEKALVQSGIPARSFADFNNNFVIGRSFSLNMGVYDTRNKDFNLMVNYQGTAQTKNKLWYNFVFAIRRINIKGDSINVIV